jgi:phosphopantothenoylcysteine synthetase/decarboxylase
MTKATYNLLLGVSSSVSADKALSVIRGLHKQETKYVIKVVMTENAKNFVPEMALAIASKHPVVTTLWTELEGEVTHIELAKWCDMFVICPATANIIGKIANGIADDALSTVALAVPEDRSRVMFPAMNVNMYENRVMQHNIEKLEGYGWDMIEPGHGLLACGDTGRGKLLSTPEIIKKIFECRPWQSKRLKGETE